MELDNMILFHQSKNTQDGLRICWLKGRLALPDIKRNSEMTLMEIVQLWFQKRQMINETEWSWRDPNTVGVDLPSALSVEPWLYFGSHCFFVCDLGRNPAVVNCDDWWHSFDQWEVQANPPRASGKPQPFYSSKLGWVWRWHLKIVAVAQSGIRALFMRTLSVVKGSPAITTFSVDHKLLVIPRGVCMCA